MSAASLETKSKALQLRSILNQFSDISYSFARLNKDFPFDYQDEDNLRLLIDHYETLIESAMPALDRYEKAQSKTANQPSQGVQSLGVAING